MNCELCYCPLQTYGRYVRVGPNAYVHQRCFGPWLFRTYILMARRNEEGVWN
jgi:hypothetical protein